ncbi:MULTISPECIES: GNAT family N-acetyltransferase [Sphingomonas]|uniref:GNAT family N-acetyltransferase n=1 Tax=Sphingomonas TaxID=13687 RepID=UPI000DEF6968|nr:MULTISPECIES: GNAT family N-acetyltransferase [Sphingomonas]
MSDRIPTSISLRPAGGGELDAVMRIMEAAFDSSFGEAWTRAQCAGILPMHGVAMTLALSGDTPVGFSLVRTVAGESELLLLAVLPEWRGRGVGTALVDNFIADGGKAGARHLHLEVRDGNSALGLYRRAGFRLVGRRSKYYRGADGQQFDALTMAIEN